MIDDSRSIESDDIHDLSRSFLLGNVNNEHNFPKNDSNDSHSHPSDLNSDLTILGIALCFGACILLSLIF